MDSVRGRGGLGAVVAALLACAVAASSGPVEPARAQGSPACAGDTTGSIPEPRPTQRKLLFGIFPGGRAGAVFGPQQESKPESPQRILSALASLRGGRPFVAHLYLNWNNGPDVPARIAEVEADVARYARAGIQSEVVLAYRPAGRRGAPDVADFVRFTRRMVTRLGPRRGLKAIQVMNEVNNTLSPEASDGAYPGAREALVQAVPAASETAQASRLTRLEIGFNWFYRLDPATEQGFWEYIRDNGGPRFAAAVDWVGLDAYPGTYFPPGGLSRFNSMVNAMSALRECYMPVAGIGAAVPIHVTENGWPTGPGRSYDEQVSALREMTGAVCTYRGNYNVTDYRWFDLRDGNSSAPDFQQQYGLTRDDYSPKPAFAAYRDVIAGPCGATATAGGARPALRLAISPPFAGTGRRTRFRVRVTTRSGARYRPVRGALVRFGGRRLRTDRAGRATVVLRFSRAGRRRATAARRGYRPASAVVRVVGRPRACRSAPAIWRC